MKTCSSPVTCLGTLTYISFYFFVVIFVIIIPLLLRESFVGVQAAQPRCINYRKVRSDTVLHITNDLKTLNEKFNIVIKP